MTAANRTSPTIGAVDARNHAMEYWSEEIRPHQRPGGFAQIRPEDKGRFR
jgi:hypothetical protein